MKRNSDLSFARQSKLPLLHSSILSLQFSIQLLHPSITPCLLHAYLLLSLSRSRYPIPHDDAQLENL